MSYRIITDSCCDLPEEQYAELGVSMIPLCLTFRGVEQRDLSEAFLKEMYAGMRAGETGSTAAVNPTEWADAMEPVLAEGLDVLVLAFSSGLSTTYQSAVIAADELREKYPERKIYVVDTLCASRGQGMLVWYAANKQKAGMGLEEVKDWCEENKLHLCHWFTVDDLMHLKRGGRVSAATALLGTMLNIKPVLHMDDEGHLINVSKARGRKASIDAIVNKMVETGIEGANETVFICHGDCMADAQYLEDQVRAKCGVKNVITYYTGAVIGSHSGPGTLALFFLGKQR